MGILINYSKLNIFYVVFSIDCYYIILFLFFLFLSFIVFLLFFFFSLLQIIGISRRSVSSYSIEIP